MCSIFGMFDLQPGDDLAALRRQALELSQRQRHRGPDWSGVFVAGLQVEHAEDGTHGLTLLRGDDAQNKRARLWRALLRGFLDFFRVYTPAHPLMRGLLALLLFRPVAARRRFAA